MSCRLQATPGYSPIALRTRVRVGVMTGEIRAVLRLAEPVYDVKTDCGRYLKDVRGHEIEHVEEAARDE